MDIYSLVNVVDDDIITKLGSTFRGSLNIHDDKTLGHVAHDDDIVNCHVGKGHVCGGFDKQGTTLKGKSLKECSTFPYLDMEFPPSCSSDDEEADTSLTEPLPMQSPHQSYSCSAPAKLVSAMKGSREKNGASQMKLSVKWAPDVYDPVPTLSSHTVKIKKQHKSRNKKSEKKYVKKGQKGNYSKGSSGKYKQYHYRWSEYCGKGFDASMELNNLKVVSHDLCLEISNSQIPATKNPCHVGEALSNILDFVSFIKTA